MFGGVRRDDADNDKGCNCVRNHQSATTIEIGFESLVRTELCEDIDTSDQEVDYKKGSDEDNGGHKGCKYLYYRG